MKTRKNSEEALQKRRAAGQWIAERRRAAGYTQATLAKALGYDWPTFVSQIEAGHNRIPWESLEDWARVLSVDPTDMAKTLLSYYDPALFNLLYARKGSSEYDPALVRLLYARKSASE